MPHKRYKNKTAQEIQDDIFRKMSANRKLEIGAALWKFAKQLAGDNFNYATRINRPAKTSRSGSQDT